MMGRGAMNRIVSLVIGALALLFCAAPAAAQSGCVYIVPRAILTAGQWNWCLSQKLDALGYVPLNPATLLGVAPITVTPSAGVIQIGISPVVPGTIVTAGAVAPVGGLPLYAAPMATGSGNCLSSGNACTLATACSFVRQIATFLGAAGPINLLPGSGGSYSTITNGIPICHIIGDGGGSTSQIVQIVGDIVTQTNVVIAPSNNNLGFSFEDHATASVSGVEIIGGGSGSIGIQCRQLAICDYSYITWAGSGSHFAAAPNASGNCSGTETVLTNFAIHWDIETGSAFNGGCQTNFPNAITWSLLIQGTSANITLGGWTWTAVGGLVGGQGFNGVGPGRLVLPANASCASQMPGSAASCQFSPPYTDSFGEGITGSGALVAQQAPAINNPVIQPNLYSTLPGSPTAGQISYIVDGKASNCGDSSCTTWGTTVTGGGGGLNLFLWNNGSNWTLIGK